jgi:hypothetical protein
LHRLLKRGKLFGRSLQFDLSAEFHSARIAQMFSDVNLTKFVICHSKERGFLHPARSGWFLPQNFMNWRECANLGGSSSSLTNSRMCWKPIQG